MTTKRKKPRLKNGTSYKATRNVSTKPLPWGGDHGTGTAAAMAGTKIVEMDGPNHMAQRVRTCEIDQITSLTMRQAQAAHAIRDAYGHVARLTSGSPLKERVQSSPKPDATIAAQIDAQSRLVRCTKAIPRADRGIVDHLCWDNAPLGILARRGVVRPLARFVMCMDRVADALGY